MTFQIKDWGLKDYSEMYDAMRTFNAQRCAATSDQIWLLEHAAVYTLGLSKNKEHLLDIKDIPVIETDRGGQVTYHGPGQLIAYLLIDLEKREYKIKKLVSLIEQAVIDYLKSYNIFAERKIGAPGVYVNEEKIAALGIRVRKWRTYHGLAFNVDMDLEPFNGINPCGYSGLKCTQLSNFIEDITIQQVKEEFPEYLLKYLDLTSNLKSNVA
ncbi:MAG: lipoyl(octanoyl) transferase LipB [Proteobacteria bacterium]|nr:lipoyl(octanoyl) transferase LipB [Pseudomonadota bacterium]